MSISLELNDQLPTVVALQVLLNRSGIECRISGKYDSDTKDSVERFQREKMGPGVIPNGIIAGAYTWLGILANTSLRVVDVLDVTDPNLCHIAGGFNNPLGKPIITGAQSNSIPRLMSEIAGKASGGQILLLRFHGHGNAGTIGISDGMGLFDPAGQEDLSHRTALSYKNVDSLAGELFRIRLLFAPYGSVEIHGCEAGRDREGQELLRKLASIWGVPVSAPTSRQTVGAMKDNTRFEGQVRTEFPNCGTLASWAAQIASDQRFVCTP